MLDTARDLRRKQTPAEEVFWHLVRSRRFLGLKFRRQHQLGDYVADFYCHDHRLVIELDGGVHASKRSKDRKRDAWMQAQGYAVIRFPNAQLLDNPESVLSAIAEATLPSPAGKGAGGESPAIAEAALPSPLGRGVGGEGMVESFAFDHLFPARLIDSELGEIPEGWEVKPIGELAEVVGGSTPKTELAEYWDGGTHHWVTPKDLSGLSTPVLLATERKTTDAGLGQISSGLLPKGTVLLSSRAPIGYLAIAEVPVAVNQGFIAMKPRQGVPNLFLLRWARAAHDEILSHANGSTFLEISKASFRPIRTVAPPARVLGAFDRLSRPMYCKVVEDERESRNLAALRDALLPKLISGELRVKDAERVVREVV